MRHYTFDERHTKHFILVGGLVPAGALCLDGLDDAAVTGNVLDALPGQQLHLHNAIQSEYLNLELY